MQSMERPQITKQRTTSTNAKSGVSPTRPSVFVLTVLSIVPRKLHLHILSFLDILVLRRRELRAKLINDPPPFNPPLAMLIEDSYPEFQHSIIARAQCLEASLTSLLLKQKK